MRHAFVAGAVLGLAAVGAARSGEPRVLAGPIRVVVRTRQAVHVGRDLRYGDGTFRLRAEGGELRVAAGDVCHVAFLREPREGPGRDLVVGLAARVAARLPVLRGRWAHKHVFFLPSERPTEAFPRLASQVSDPEAVAFLCAELTVNCLARGAPQDAAELLAKAEERARPADKQAAFVYALMRAAVLVEPRNLLDLGRTARHLTEAYPEQAGRVRLFVRVARVAGRRGPPPPDDRPDGRKGGPWRPRPPKS